MKIINSRKEGRFVNVETEDGLSRRILKKKAEDMDLNPGADLDEGALQALWEESEYIFAKETALSALARGPKCEGQIRSKLKEKSVPETAVNQIVEFLRHNALLDDRSFAETFASVYMNKAESKESVRRRLKSCELDDLIIENVLEGYESEREYENCLRLCRKKAAYRASEEDEAKFKQKLENYLKGKLFPYDAVKEAVEIVINERN